MTPRVTFRGERPSAESAIDVYGYAIVCGVIV